MKLIFLLLIAITTTYSSFNKGIDNLVVEIAYNLKINPYGKFYFNIDNNDLLNNIEMGIYTDELIKRLNHLCEEALNKKTSELKIYWLKKIDIENKDKLAIVVLRNKKVLFTTKFYEIEEKSEYDLQAVEKQKFTIKLLSTLNEFNGNILHEDYSFLSNNRIPIFQKNKLEKLFTKLFNIKFNQTSLYKIELNKLNNLFIPTIEKPWEIIDIFDSVRYKNKFLLYVFNGEKFIETEEIDKSLIVYSDSLISKKIFFPLENGIFKIINKAQYIEYLTKHRKYELQFNDKTIALIHDDLDYNRIWKISQLDIAINTKFGNLISLKKYYKIENINYRDEKYYSGKYEILVIDYSLDYLLTLDTTLNNINKELDIIFKTAISGISIRLINEIKKIIKNDVAAKTIICAGKEM